LRRSWPQRAPGSTGSTPTRRLPSWRRADFSSTSVADRRRFGALPGAVVVERNVLEWRLDPASPDRLDGIDDGAYDRPIVVFCNDGYASSLAAADLQRLGLRRATDLVGGFNAWAASGHPVADRPAD
jgi:rhodanese-related sulfurtransferase